MTDREFKEAIKKAVRNVEFREATRDAWSEFDEEPYDAYTLTDYDY